MHKVKTKSGKVMFLEQCSSDEHFEQKWKQVVWEIKQ